MTEAVQDRRRRELRAQTTLNGIDFVELGEDQRSLTVTFFHPPPRDLGVENFLLTGGVRIPAPPVIEVRLHDPADPSQEPTAKLVFQHRGDDSTYRLQLCRTRRFDSLFAAVDFSFGNAVTPPRREAAPEGAGAAPELDYLAKDDAGFRRVAFDRLALTLPGWAERHTPDMGVMLVEMMARIADQLSWYQDAVATEAYLGTARLRTSVRRHARLIDYTMHEGCNARAWLHLATDADLVFDAADLGFAVGFEAPDLMFLPVFPGEVRLFTALNAIPLYDWGDGRAGLLRGAVAATLEDAWVGKDRSARCLDGLEAGQAMLLDAQGDLGGRCHVIRLREVRRTEDALFGSPVVEVLWAAEDALPFDLAAGKDAAEGLVARGNMLLADHGRMVSEAALKERLASALQPRRPVLRDRNLTFRAPVDADAPASLAAVQDPRLAEPQVLTLTSRIDPDVALPGEDTVAWSVRPDLIESAPMDRHYVVEMSDEGRACLRFGDGLRGARLGDGSIAVRYRVGSGPMGNVEAGSINRVLPLGNVAVGGIDVRNPLSATGGCAPEPVETVRRIAPGSIRIRQERAVTAEDYGMAAERVFGVRRAKADLLGLGAIRLARIAILPTEGEDTSPALLERVASYLETRRRIGHEIEVRPARIVALDIALEVGVREGYLRAPLRVGLRDVLGAGAHGLFRPELMNFGDAVRGSRIIAAVQAVTGVEWVRLVRLRRLEDPHEDELEEAGTLVLSAFEVPRMDDDARYPEYGRLSVTLRGGR